MSLVLIWDAWNKHTGQPSLFRPSRIGAKPASAAGPGPGALPAPTTPATTAAAPVATGAVVPAAAAASAPESRSVTVSTDLLKATLDGKGATLMRLELLKQADQNDRQKNMVLFDQSARACTWRRPI